MLSKPMVQSKPPTSKKPAKRSAAKATGGRKAKEAKFSPPSPARVAEIFARFAAVDPAPKGELEHTNPFTLLVAVVLSAQATDAGVNKATRALFLKADTPEKMAALGED